MNVVVCIIGCDPGTQGAFCVASGFEDGTLDVQCNVTLVDMPTERGKIDWGGVRDILIKARMMANVNNVPILLGLEEPFYNPKHPSSIAPQTRNMERIWGAALSLFIPRVSFRAHGGWNQILPPRLYEKENSKDRARRFIVEEYGFGSELCDGKADAVCIAHHTFGIWSRSQPHGKKTKERRPEDQ